MLSEPCAYRFGKVTLTLCTTKTSFLFLVQFTAFLAQHMPANSSNWQELNLPISIDEVELAIARLNFGKAPRLDKIQGSYLTS